MLSRPYATPLRVELGPSRILRTWLVTTHATALLVLPLLPLPGGSAAAPALLVLLSLAVHWRRQAGGRHSQAVRALRWEAGRDCVLELAGGGRVAVRLAPRAFVMPWLVILYFHGRPRSLVLLPDMLPAGTFRRLRVRLRLELQQQPAA